MIGRPSMWGPLKSAILNIKRAVAKKVLICNLCRAGPLTRQAQILQTLLNGGDGIGRGIRGIMVVFPVAPFVTKNFSSSCSKAGHRRIARRSADQNKRSTRDSANEDYLEKRLNPKWMRQGNFRAWGIQTGTFWALLM